MLLKLLNEALVSSDSVTDVDRCYLLRSDDIQRFTWWTSPVTLPFFSGLQCKHLSVIHILSSALSHRYNPENLATLERYVETQARENAYDLEANLAVLKLYVSTCQIQNSDSTKHKSLYHPSS